MVVHRVHWVGSSWEWGLGGVGVDHRCGFRKQRVEAEIQHQRELQTAPPVTAGSPLVSASCVSEGSDWETLLSASVPSNFI